METKQDQKSQNSIEAAPQGGAVSFSRGAVFAAIPKITAELGAIGRDQINQQQKFKYRGVDDLYNAICLLLAKHGVFSVPEVIEVLDRSERPSKSGGVIFHVILKIRYHFFGEDGSSFSAVVIGEGMDSGDKGSNKAMSVAHKYALTQVFTVRTQDQEDPDGETHEVGPRRANVTPKATPPKQTPAPATPQAVTNLNDWVIPFGETTKGKRIGAIPLETHLANVDKIEAEARRTGKQPVGNVLEYCNIVTELAIEAQADKDYAKHTSGGGFAAPPDNVPF